MLLNSKALTVVAAGSLLAMGLTTRASAMTFNTPVQEINVVFDSLDETETIEFDGFDATLGTLTHFGIAIEFDATLNSTVFNATPNDASVGDPTPVTATTTITAVVSGDTGVGVSDTLTTPGFTGIVPSSLGSGEPTIVRSASTTDQRAEEKFFDPPTDLSGLIGGVNSVEVLLSAIGDQGGSVPPGVFTGNNGTADVTVSVFYSYTVPDSESVPEPGTILGLLAVGTAGLVSRRRKNSH